MTGVLGAIFGNVGQFNIRYLVIAGGGGGSGNRGGGGGAGGYRSSVTGESSGGGSSAESPFVPILETNYSVTVGAGGTAGTSSIGTSGSNSVFDSITSIGGGRGADAGPGTINALVGGSGGGGGGHDTTLTLPASGTANQGFGGGTATTGSNNSHAGGGGGAGSVGSNAGINNGGNGGAGVVSTITGPSVARAGGGGGGTDSRLGTKTAGIGVAGGGSASNSGGIGGSGTANTGGGGASGGVNSVPAATAGGAGGSGVVILRYESNFSVTLGAGLIGATAIAVGGTDKVTTITSGTGNLKFKKGQNTLASALNDSTYAGLIGQYFNGDWRSTISTGNIGTLPLSAPTTYTSISYGTRGESYGFIAIGYFKPPTTGTYTFYTSSDDSSGVWVGSLASAASGRTIANATLSNNLGVGQADTKRSGTASLTADTWYAIRIVHEEGVGGDNLTFSWAGPGIAETTNLSTYFKRPVNLESSPINTFYELTV
jgi:hypothetical protein